MITINLSEHQARLLLAGLGWRENNEVTASLKVAKSVCDELFTQLEQQLMPRSTSAAELAVWRHENGLNEMDVEKWKRKNGKEVVSVPMDVVRKNQHPYYPAFEVIMNVGG